MTSWIDELHKSYQETEDELIRVQALVVKKDGLLEQMADALRLACKYPRNVSENQQIDKALGDYLKHNNTHD